MVGGGTSDAGNPVYVGADKMFIVSELVVPPVRNIYITNIYMEMFRVQLWTFLYAQCIAKRRSSNRSRRSNTEHLNLLSHLERRGGKRIQVLGF